MGFITPIPPGGVSGIGGVTPIVPPEYQVQGPQRPPTTSAPESGAGWINPVQAYSDDGIYSTAAPARNGLVSGNWGGFGFDSIIPVGAAITSVVVDYQFKVSTTASIATMRMRAKVAGASQPNHDVTNEPTADTVISQNITLDRSWSRSDLLDANFFIVFEAVRGNSNQAVTFSLDYVTVTVTWTMAQSLGVVGIISAEAFGVASLSPYIYPPSIVSGEAIGECLVVPPDILITVVEGIASAEAFGTPTLTTSAAITGAGGIASAEAFGTPSLLVQATLVTGVGGIASAEAFGVAALTTTYTLRPVEIIDQVAVGTPHVGPPESTTLSISGIASGEAFGTALVFNSLVSQEGQQGARHGGVSSIGRRAAASLGAMRRDFEQMERGL